MFYSLVTASLAIIPLYAIIIVNIRFRILFHFKGNRELNTHIEVSEEGVCRKVAEHQRLYIELHALIGLLIAEGTYVGLGRRMEVEYAEIGIDGEVHTDHIGVEMEDLVFIHMSDTCTDLRMRQDIEIPLHTDIAAIHLTSGFELMVRHIVEIIVVPLILAEGGILRLRRRRTVQIERHFRSDKEIDASPFAADEQRDIEIHHMTPIAGLIHHDVHIEDITLRIDHLDGHIDRLEMVGIHLVHALCAYREKEIIAIEAVIESDIGIHTRGSTLAGDGMQQSRIAQIAMNRHKMVGLRREASERICAHIQQQNTYYE